MKRLIILGCILLSGCGISINQSGFKAGLIIEEETMIQGESKVYTDDIIGIRIQWLPYFTWGDVCRWWNSK